MRVLVTGGAGFIGSHTCDRLIALGHDVVVLDALTPPVHREGRPEYLSREIDLYQGDTRNRDLFTNLLRRVDAVYHLAAYQDYLPDFSRFSDVNVFSTALLYEIIVAERLDLARVVVASSQAAMGEGLYLCPVDGEQLPGMRPEGALAARQWNIPCPECGGPLQMQATPERVSNPQNAYGMSKLGEEMVAINLGRRYGIPTVALRYSIVQGPRQSVYNAYSGACRIFCLSYLLGTAPTLYEDGAAIRDYVNIGDVVDANMLVLTDERAVGRVFNVGGGKAVTTSEFADIVMRQYGSSQPGEVTGEYRFGDTRHILSDISALGGLGWTPQRTPAESVAAYAEWLGGMPGLGQTLSFKIETPSASYHVDILRVGYYQGNGARIVAKGILPTATLPQSQPACKNDSAPTGLVDCGNWAVSASWTVPATATSSIRQKRRPASSWHQVIRCSVICISQAPRLLLCTGRPCGRSTLVMGYQGSRLVSGESNAAQRADRARSGTRTYPQDPSGAGPLATVSRAS